MPTPNTQVADDAAGPLPALPGSHGEAPPGFRLPSATRLGTVRLQVTDLDRSIAWYVQVLGLAVIARQDTAAALGVPGNAEPLMILEHRAGSRPVRPGSRLGLYHVALLLPDRAALGRFIQHLAQHGLRAGASDHLVSEAVYLQDPDGLGIEVYADRSPAHWRRAGRELQMATDPLDIAAVVASAQGGAWTGAPAGTSIGHVHLHVGDLDVANAFYHAALGFDRMVWRYPGALFLAAGGYHHHLGINTWAAGAAAPGPDEAQLLGWTLVLPAAADVAALARSAGLAGYDVTRSDQGVLLADPWGTRLWVTSAA
ncbi:MAG: VOC family protein [Gemmatimonas sp.]|jgi:catechol 2,3-dioxygenase|uniref:VOC family protein n=1 Tax=Gemmatimonas sp. TaxID=1962908 RepID=UPI00391EF9A2